MLKGLGFLILVLCVISASFLLRKSHDQINKPDAPLILSVFPRDVASVTQTKTASQPLGDQTARVQKKISTLNEILASKNDNDPRLDTEFRVLNSAEKKALRARYSAFKHEMLNERGTIIFLLGRNITSEQDMEFLNQVLAEPPCLSMKNCLKTEKKETDPEATHLNSINSVTLAYPQVVTIKSLENLLNQTSNTSLKTLAVEGLHVAAHSKSPTVADLARSTLKKLNSEKF